MKRHVVILGAGFGGLELATRLSDSVVDDVRVTLIDQNDSFSFGFSKLDILFGRKTAADGPMQYRDISKEGVEFRQERVTSIDPEKRRVETDHGSYDADVLAVALGAEYDFAATPGFEEGGSEYYSVAGRRSRRASSVLSTSVRSSTCPSSGWSSSTRTARRRDSKAAELCHTTCSSGSLSTVCPQWSRTPGSRLTGGCPWITPT